MELFHKKVLGEQGFLDSPLSQYEHLKQLGKGAFGTVSLYKHRNSGLQVAIKKVEKAKMDSLPAENGKVLSELEMSETITGFGQNNLVQTVETFEDALNYMIVTEFLPGGDLINYLCRKYSSSVPEEDAKQVIRHVATGLQALHACGIVHRDVKPDNILVGKSEQGLNFKLGDYGIASFLDPLTATSTLPIGTEGYISPEIA
jgi:serine/threonine protein kinase